MEKGFFITDTCSQKKKGGGGHENPMSLKVLTLQLERKAPHVRGIVIQKEKKINPIRHYTSACYNIILSKTQCDQGAPQNPGNITFKM